MQKSLLNTLLTIAALLPLSSFAADGTISFTGSITAQTCTINGGASGASNIAVTLPKVSSTALATPGAKAGQTPFTIALTGCTPASGNVRAFFETGPNVDIATGRLKNTGTATNVQIGLTNTDGSNIVVGAASGSQGTSYVAISSGSANLNYMAQYIATGAATGGTVTTSVTYTIEFQ